MANPVAARLATSYVATVIAITTDPLIEDTSAALQTLRTRSAVRTILITLGDHAEPPVDRTEDATTIHGLLPQFVNNAVAALRLSSLPSLAWWRRPEAQLLGDLATLVDRIVLDVPHPAASWEQARRLRELTSFSDLRWARLTRWRGLMAQFFDLPDVRAAADTYRLLNIAASDTDAARLFAAWMRTRLPHGKDLAVSVSQAGDGDEPVTSVSLRGESHQLALRLMANRTCVETAVRRDEQPDAVRVVPLGNRSPSELLAEEMRVRSRDIAFEAALEGVEQV
jgi:glucose-6-phosphate dehydrogenase assembly protein OpcA